MGRKLKALASQGVMSAWVMALLPPVLLGAITVVDPSFSEPLFHTAPGRGILLFSVVWEGLGAFWITRILKAALR